MSFKSCAILTERPIFTHADPWRLLPANYDVSTNTKQLVMAWDCQPVKSKMAKSVMVCTLCTSATWWAAKQVDTMDCQDLLAYDTAASYLLLKKGLVENLIAFASTANSTWSATSLFANL